MAGKPVQFRAQIPPYLDFLVRAIAPLKNSGQDWGLSAIANEALTEWLQKEENRALIKKHSLEGAALAKGIELPEGWMAAEDSAAPE